MPPGLARETGAVLQGGVGVVDRTGPDDDEQAVVTPGQDVDDLGTPRTTTSATAPSTGSSWRNRAGEGSGVIADVRCPSRVWAGISVVIGFLSRTEPARVVTGAGSIRLVGGVVSAAVRPPTPSGPER